MNCEICGAEIKGKSHRIVIERSELNVCDNCARYGRNADKPSIPRKAAYAQRAKVKARRRDIYSQIIDEIVPDYNEVIRRARSSNGLTQEELAVKIKERVSLVKKIERGEMTPDDAVRKKIERILNIRLVENVEKVEPSMHAPLKTTTLGDVAIIKRKHQSRDL